MAMHSEPWVALGQQLLWAKDGDREEFAKRLLLLMQSFWSNSKAGCMTPAGDGWSLLLVGQLEALFGAEADAASA